MTTWKLSTEYKKNAVEVQLWYKDGVTIKLITGYRWGTFYCESDDRPNIDLHNPDGEYQLDGDGYDWELDNLDDGCWSDWEYPDEVSEEEREKIEAAWSENWYEGVEELGWSQDDTEYWFQGPLLLVNCDTGEEFSVLDENGNIKPKETWNPAAELEKIVADQEPELTNWFTPDMNPVRTGRYQVTVTESTTWPFPIYATWDGQTWDQNISAWRGLANDPNT